MSPFAHEIEQILGKSGWYPERRVDTSEFERVLSRNGYPILSNKIREFLSEFGDLSIPLYRDYVEFDVARAADILPNDGEEPDCTAMIGVQAWPIGKTSDYWLFMDQIGRVLGLFKPYLDLLGETGEEGISNLLSSPIKIVKRLSPYNDDVLREIFISAKSIAVISDFSDSSPYSRELQTAQFFEEGGYTVFLISGVVDKVATRNCYHTLLDVPESVDMIIVFGRSEDLGQVVREASSIKTRLIWIQSHVSDIDASRQAKELRIEFVMDHSSMKEVYTRLFPTQ